MMIQQLYVLLATLVTLLVLGPIALWPIIQERLEGAE